MARGKVFAKSLLLVILIVILVLFGILWFDVGLGLYNSRDAFSKVFGFFGIKGRTSQTETGKSLVDADLDNDRYAKRLEALNLRAEELKKLEDDVGTAQKTNVQVAQELEDKEKTLIEREKTFNNLVKKYDTRDKNIEAIVANLNGMPPKDAVGIMVEMDDQDVIDVLRKADEIAAANGESSTVAYWLSLMPKERSAEINRKMANKPLSIDQ